MQITLVPLLQLVGLLARHELVHKSLPPKLCTQQSTNRDIRRPTATAASRHNRTLHQWHVAVNMRQEPAE